jgi:hypothetical protein
MPGECIFYGKETKQIEQINQNKKKKKKNKKKDLTKTYLLVTPFDQNSYSIRLYRIKMSK